MPKSRDNLKVSLVHCLQTVFPEGARSDHSAQYLPDDQKQVQVPRNALQILHSNVRLSDHAALRLGGQSEHSPVDLGPQATCVIVRSQPIDKKRYSYRSGDTLSAKR
jgi:hypothetical protein